MTWEEWWSNQREQIGQSLTLWRQSGRARMRLPDLATKSNRNDLYDYITVTFNRPSSKGSGKRHLLELERAIAPMLNQGESVTVSIVRVNDGDYLEFSRG